MDIKIKGGQVLSGEITPSGSKNSVVALVPATILFDKPVTLKNVPDITDVPRLVKILEKLGSKINWDKSKQTLTIDNSKLRFENLDREDLGNMKGTSLLWGPMLARFKEVNFTELPGGCTLGTRPLGPQYDTFRELGVKVNETPHSACMSAKHARACEVWLPEMSPTITENVIMLASSLKGTSKIVGAASEPQVQDLCEFLVKCGADISGVGSSVLVVNGGKKLIPKPHDISSDHYEIATFLALAAATGGEMKIHKAIPAHMKHILYIFSKFGIKIEYKGDTAILKRGQKIRVEGNDGNGTLTVRAQPWPSLPVDLLPVFIPLALASQKGQVLFHNWMYESGLFWTSELTKLGANIVMCDPHRVIINGGRKLRGDTLEAPYIIRAVVALVMSAMIAKGESVILNADALYRGHPNFAVNLRKLGAIIEEIG
ncbi:UDP-N-acetylglucosamine 1-carboxyvinyltransferase [Candidatus Microgenomates bacterium]|nr:MAG: UDP-N-acetylglucosamine 1-carboxyvinyltransferase [Candidatus Microgenomates bacterium]